MWRDPNPAHIPSLRSRRDPSGLKSREGQGGFGQDAFKAAPTRLSVPVAGSVGFLFKTQHYFLPHPSWSPAALSRTAYLSKLIRS